MNGLRPMTGVQDVMALRSAVLERSNALREVRAASEAGQGFAPAQAPVQAPGAGFADTLNSALRQVNAVQQHSGDMQVAYERGQVTDIAQVMLARQEAGVAFEATLQVRNKLLNAYQDIMRMGG
ncbi:flagellar hook-basal body complex protein FliE [Porphyrobacter sp. AAP60]|uniref:flagellar hook-basal body complex protein FliE n=1 Tax=Porphyrobacter sp. AAP60 TaxID=1523423 RepID=UPI0006B99F71|nr:flagellar hook-basal body complex protein FliE [Porphyrobacter sp. AAP60]KPF63592.1 flagellar hook-basal body protein FliE [Porphyrobacter sp. AAP60]